MRKFVIKNNILGMAIFAIVSTSSLAVTDEDITSQIRSKLQSNGISTVQVSINNGIVILSGNVATQQQAATAIQEANSIDGVKDVNTVQLLVQADPNAPPLSGSQADQDAYITAKVQGLFARENLYSNAPPHAIDIHVETKDGVVYLTGSPATQTQQNNAVFMIKSMDGVKDVRSSVSLTPGTTP